MVSLSCLSVRFLTAVDRGVGVTDMRAGPTVFLAAAVTARLEGGEFLSIASAFPLDSCMILSR